MRSRTRIAIPAAVFLAMLALSKGGWADEAADRVRIETLARQFHVQPGLIEMLCREHRSWDEITVELAMAQRLSRVNPNNFPIVPEALQRVDSLRNEGKEWDQISQDLGFELDLERMARGEKEESAHVSTGGLS